MLLPLTLHSSTCRSSFFPAHSIHQGKLKRLYSETHCLPAAQTFCAGRGYPKQTGWDALGFYFKVERRYSEARWGQRLLNLDVSYLELLSVEQSRIDIQQVLAQDLGRLRRVHDQSSACLFKTA